MISHESNETEALAYLRDLKNGGAFEEPFKFVEARFYEFDEFREWVKSGDTKVYPKPFRIVADLA